MLVSLLIYLENNSRRPRLRPCRIRLYCKPLFNPLVRGLTLKKPLVLTYDVEKLKRAKFQVS